MRTLASHPNVIGIVAVASVALAGCLSVDPPEGRLACTADTDCPSGWACRSDSRCYRTGDGADGGARSDGGGEEDGARPDASMPCMDEAECDDMNA
jgi:hypothetical protein